MPNQQLPPQQLGRQASRPKPDRANKKALVITDKDGNPIDLSKLKKLGSKESAAAKETKADAVSDSQLQQSSRQPQQAIPNQQLPPQQLGRQAPPKPRAKKDLLITDKDGNPIDLKYKLKL